MTISNTNSGVYSNELFRNNCVLTIPQSEYKTEEIPEEEKAHEVESLTLDTTINCCSQTILKNQNQVQPENIPFDKEIHFSDKEMCQLGIGPTGLSDLYPDSIFDCRVEWHGLKLDYYITRHLWKPSLEVYIPVLNGNDMILIKNFPQLSLLIKQKINFSNFYSIKILPENTFVGSTKMGQEHLVSQGKLKLSLILDRFPHNYNNIQLKEGETFTMQPDKVGHGKILVSPLCDEAMQDSFSSCYRQWDSFNKIPKCKYIAGVKGLAFVKDLNQWGVLYEHVNGHTLEEACGYIFQNHLQIRSSFLISQAMKLVEGIQILDETGCGYTELLSNNILFRKGRAQAHDPVLIGYQKNEVKKGSIKSRQQFGKILFQLSAALHSKIQDLQQLADDCCSEMTLDEFSWDIVTINLMYMMLSEEQKEKNAKSKSRRSRHRASSVK